MKLFEMEGFLRGKCIPRDLKVNETNAEYLVRKFAEADAMCAALAAENAGIKNSIPKLKDIDYGNDNMDDVSLAEDIGFNDAVTLMSRWMTETPATDYFLAEVRAQGVDSAVETIMVHMNHQHAAVAEALHIIRTHAAQLRKGVQS